MREETVMVFPQIKCGHHFFAMIAFSDAGYTNLPFE
jgi:hypothetical protein